MENVHNILLVDDKPANLLSLEALLADCGANLLKVSSGRQALEIAMENDLALILMDVQMPEMDGFETAELLRGTNKTRLVPIIFVTAINKDQKYVFKGYDIGAVDYLIKPIEPSILLSKVNVFLDLDRQKKELQRIGDVLRDNEFLLEEAQGVARLGWYMLDIVSGKWTSSEVLNDVFGIENDYNKDIKGWLKLVHPDQRQEIDEYFYQEVLAKKQSFDKEYKIIRPYDQKVRWVHGLGKLDFKVDGTPNRMIGTIQDITDRKKIQDDIVKQKSVLEGINKLFHDCLTCKTEEEVASTCLFVAEELTGSQFGYLGEINEKGLFDAIALSNPGWEACHMENPSVKMRNMEIRSYWGEVMKSGKSKIVNDPANHPLRVGTPEGHPPLTCFLGVPLKRAGKTIGIIALANKNSKYTKCDQEMIELLSVAFVEALLQKRTEIEVINQRKKLEKINTELQRSNQDLDDFAYIASHDMKEPLRGIYNYSQFLIEDYADKLDSEGSSKLKTLRKLAKRMEDLINSILDFSRVGRTDLKVKNASLQEVLDEVLETLEIRLKEEKVDVRVLQQLPHTECDSVMIGEVFRNLITNAMKYNNKPEKWIEIGCDSNNGNSNCPVFYVRDNGIGIQEKHFDSIFGVFKRLHGRDKYGCGTGIGLTIVKKIVERHTGKIWVESTYEEGTTFYFTLNDKMTESNNQTGKEEKENDSCREEQKTETKSDEPVLGNEKYQELTSAM